MMRCCTLAMAGWFTLLAAAPGQDKKLIAGEDVKIDGQIVPNDLPDKVRNNPCKIHTVKLTKDKTYIIDLESKDFDAYLRIEDSAGKQLAQDDDGGEGLNSRLRFVPAKSDNYQIIATTFGGGAGTYTLKIRGAGPAKKEALPASADGKVHTVGDGLKIESQITKDDPKDRARRNSNAKVYLVKMAKDKTYTIDMESGDIDSFLRLENEAGTQLKYDDDGGDNLNARIIFRAETAGTYRIVATTFGGDMGPFTLKIREE